MVISDASQLFFCMNGTNWFEKNLKLSLFARDGVERNVNKAMDW